MIFCQYSLNIDKKAWIERRNQNSVIPDLIRDPDPYFASRILHFSCTIAQCVGKRRLMSVKKFSVSFFSRRSATGTLAKNEVFAPATRVRLGRKLGASFFCNFSLRLSALGGACPPLEEKRKVNPEFAPVHLGWRKEKLIRYLCPCQII